MILARQRSCAAPALCLLLLIALPTRVYGFTINEVQAEIRGELLIVTANISHEFTGVVVKALESGIPMTLKSEIIVYSKRAALWDKRIALRRLVEVISFRTFPVTYVVESHDTAISGAYDRYRDAIAALGGTRQYELQLPPDNRQSDRPTHAKMRIGLDRTKLPGTLQMQGYLNSAWRLRSKWIEFQVQ